MSNLSTAQLNQLNDVVRAAIQSYKAGRRWRAGAGLLAGEIHRDMEWRAKRGLDPVMTPEHEALIDKFCERPAAPNSRRELRVQVGFIVRRAYGLPEGDPSSEISSELEPARLALVAA